jgi:hypothetical protein
VGHVVIQDERVLQFDPGDRPAVAPEPAGGGEVLAIEPSEFGRDLPVRAQLPVLIITCLTNV